MEAVDAHRAQLLLMPGLVGTPAHCGGSLAASLTFVPPADGITKTSVWGWTYIPSGSLINVESGDACLTAATPADTSL